MKKIISPLIALIIGLAVGIYYERSATELSFDTSNDADILTYFKTNKTQGARPFLRMNDSIEIARAVSDSIIKHHLISKPHSDSIRTSFVNFNDGSWLRGRMLTNDGQRLKAYFIPKPLIDAIFTKYKDCTGIRMWLAKDDRRKKRIFSFVLVGTHPAVRSFTLGENDPNYDGDDDLHFNYVDTCPNNCGN